AEPAPVRTVDDPRAVAQVLADFADLKSTFTLGHSRRVATLARQAAQALGLPAADVEAVELAGWLHDVGRVSVSNAIWDKPGPLARGQVDKEIAAALGISHRTVHHHNQSIFGKLEVTTRGAAALFAIEQNLL